MSETSAFKTCKNSLRKHGWSKINYHSIDNIKMLDQCIKQGCQQIQNLAESCQHIRQSITKHVQACKVEVIISNSFFQTGDEKNDCKKYQEITREYCKRNF